ncbi:MULTISPECIES: hypothetical protein [unclassified Marinobacterium]|uniref:hypothetical protein n=1 Tax=unclassified Marinobacterium TaxID=2644139 RepID=UPI00156912B7|nr:MULTISPECIES: hypothetical protein [unclassified Marinobacterium]NRP93971.1 hypothetical protein [Marinobacterium sp. xm-g-59]NRQ02662.1 hypothetical protein [Marinobacterium sp. xm-d-530]
MDSQLPSYITLLGFVVPALVFIIRLDRYQAATIVHALLMALLCLFVGFLFSGAAIKLMSLSNPLLTSGMVVVGSGVATLARLIWIKRFA